MITLQPAHGAPRRSPDNLQTRFWCGTSKHRHNTICYSFSFTGAYPTPAGAAEAAKQASPEAEQA